MSDELIDRLARENPVPHELPMLPIEPVLGRLDEHPNGTVDVHAPRDLLDGIALPPRARLRLPRGGTVTAVVSIAVTVVVAAAGRDIRSSPRRAWRGQGAHLSDCWNALGDRAAPRPGGRRLAAGVTTAPSGPLEHRRVHGPCRRELIAV